MNKKPLQLEFLKFTHYKINFQSYIRWKPRRERIMDCKLNWFPKFNNHVIVFAD